MATKFRCKKCGISIIRREELQRHLHWHQITDRNVDGYFTEEQVDDVPEVAAPAVAAASSGVLGAKAFVASAVVLLVVIALVLLRSHS